jgi:predicted esterase
MFEFAKWERYQMVKHVITLLVGFGLMNSAFGQSERYELGRRLRLFEAEWERQTDPAARKRALVMLPKVTEQFFSFRLGEAGRTLDEARFALFEKLTGPGIEKVPPVNRWMASLSPIPELRLIDAERLRIDVSIKSFYTIRGADFSRTHAWWNSADGAISGRIGSAPLKVPYSGTLSFHPIVDRSENHAGEVRIKLDMKCDDAIVESHGITVTRVQRLKERLAILQKPHELPELEAATVAETANLLKEIADGEVPETDLPLSHLLHQADSILANGPKPFFTLNVPHVSWLCVPVGKKTRTPIRIAIPSRDGKDNQERYPLVVALHGAGGTENLFFDGYGAGRIVKECAKRRWMVIAPRSPGFVTPADVPAIVEQLSKRYPIDKSRIFLVGHSMGAGQAIELCQTYSDSFAGMAALGGGGRIRDVKTFVNLPTFIGIGTKDFALSGCRSLRKSLSDGGAKQLTFREYPDLEHLVIVREALPDVFAMFDEVVNTKPKVRP